MTQTNYPPEFAPKAAISVLLFYKKISAFFRRYLAVANRARVATSFASIVLGLAIWLLHWDLAQAYTSGCLSPSWALDSASEINALWTQHPELGCPTSLELNAAADTRAQNFKNGQIHHLRRASETGRLVALVIKKHAVDRTIMIFWRASGSIDYHYWEVIWRLDYSTKPTAPEGTQACEESGSCIGRILIGAETSTACASVNTPVTSITKTEGCHELFAKVVAGEKTMVHGTYIIDVSGCTLVSLNSVSGPTSTCAPLASVKVEFGGIDLFDVPSAQDLKDAEDWRSTRARIVNQYACQLPLATEKDGHFGEDITSILLAKLFFASDPHTDFSGSLYLDCDRLNDRFLMAPRVNGFLESPSGKG